MIFITMTRKSQAAPTSTTQQQRNNSNFFTFLLILKSTSKVVNQAQTDKLKELLFVIFT